MIHSRFSGRTIYCETGNVSSECVSFFFFIPVLSLVTFVWVYSFINKYLLTLLIVLQILKGQIVCRRLWYFQQRVHCEKYSSKDCVNEVVPAHLDLVSSEV